MHQMSVNGKFDALTRADLLAFSDANGIKDASLMIDNVCDVAARWPEIARVIGVPEDLVKEIYGNMLLRL